MKKSTMSMAAAAVGLAAAVVSPAAQAATPWSAWGVYDGNVGSKSTAANLEVLGSDGNNGGGWCDNGKPTAAIAVHTLKGSETVYIRYFTSQSDSPTLKLVNVTTKGVLVPVPAGFAATSPGSNAGSMYFSNTSDIITTVAAANSNNVATFGAEAPASCAGLPTKAPALPAAWGNVSTPTKTSTPVKTPTPVTSSASATATVKVTTPAGTKTTSTTAVVPVTKPIPAGGVTQTATVKVPSKGETAKATVTVNPITPSVQPTSSSTSTTGPKIQTDKVGSSSNEGLEIGLAAAIGVLAVTGGATLATRRRR